MSKPIAGGTKFVPTSEPGERIPVHTIPTAKAKKDTPSGEFVSDNDPRPLQARPGEGQKEHDGWSGFASKEKFANQGSSTHKKK